MCLFALVFSLFINTGCAEASKEDLVVDKVALQEWKEMKFGLFIHWGIYSIPAGVWEGKQIDKLGEQIQRHAPIPHQEYVALAGEFNPVKFCADSITALAKRAGMKYVVLTAKHHDGFCMFESKYTDFDIIDASPFKRDILKELAESCKKNGLKLGIYYSTPDWHFNYPNVPINPHDNKISVFGEMSKENEDYQVNQLEEILTNYGDIVELFFDMGQPTFDQSKRFAQTVRSFQPKCVINGRIMNNQGDFITMPDNHVPDVPVDTLAWETPGTFYHTWGHKSWVKGSPVPKQIKMQIRKLSQIVARGGNFLLNIGPKADGSILNYEVDVLTGIGKWMDVNSEAIMGVETTPFKKLSWGECTRGKNKLYLHVAQWPKNKKLLIPGLKNKVVKAYPLAEAKKSLKYTSNREGSIINLSGVVEDKNLTIIVLEYEGALDIVAPAIQPVSENLIVIKGNDAISHGKYGRESYRSILRDYYRTWDIYVPTPGKYQVKIKYHMKYDQKDFIISNSSSAIAFNLMGDNTAKAKKEALDGNESVKRKLNTSKGRLFEEVLGEITFTKSGRETLKMLQGQEFDFKTTVEEFNKQDRKYIKMDIEIESIILTREE